MIVVVGASGNTGSVAVESLLAKGIKVRALGRDAKRLERFTQKGAEGFVADVTDAAAVEKAFSGIEAAYVMLPPRPAAPDVRAYQEQVSDALVNAIQKNGVTHAIALSSIGADKSEKVGPVVGLHNLEEKLNSIVGLNALFIRAGYFMENLMPQAKIIQAFGMLAGPIRSDLPVRLIAAHDIGAFVADTLSKLDFTGKQSHELVGPRDVSYKEMAKIIGDAIGKPELRYMQLPAMQLKPALIQMGMSSSMASLLLEMADSLNTGYMAPLEQRTAENTTPTTLEAFVAEVFVPAYRALAANA